MDEYQLIEIAKRFRVLEDFIEQADMQLAGAQQRAIDRQQAERAGTIGEIRGELEAAVEICREDMTTMQESIRARRATA